MDFKAARAAFDAAERYRLLFESSAAGVVFIDADGRVADVNPAALSILGTTRDAILGRVPPVPGWTAVDEDGRPVPDEALPASVALRTGKPVRDVVLGLSAPDRPGRIWLSLDAYPRVRPEEERPFEVCVTLRDVTVPRESEARLRAAVARLELALDVARAGWWEQDFVTGETAWSERMWDLCGLEPADVPPSYQAWRSTIHPDDVARVENAVREGWEGRSETTVEYRFRGRDGTERWQLSRARPVPRASGEGALYLGVAIDITETRRAAEAIRARERELLAAQRIARVGSWFRDRGGREARWTPELFRIHGLEPAGSPPGVDEVLRFYSDESAARLLSAMERCWRDGAPYEVEIDLRRPEGGQGTMISRGEALRDAAGTIVALHGTVVDVTEHVRLLREVQVMRDRIARASRLSLLGELVSSLVHELGQPLTIIRTAGQEAARTLARKRPSLAGVREAVGDVVAACDRTASVLDGLRARLRQSGPARSPLDLNALARELVHLLATEARHRGIRVELELQDGLPAVEGVRGQLDQVLLNLVMNAFEALGDVSESRVVRIRTQGEDSGVGLTVEDTGPGIPAGLEGRVFEPFFTTRAEGLGLGLALGRSIVEEHGGTIEVRRTAGPGATIAVHLPALPRRPEQGAPR